MALTQKVWEVLRGRSLILLLALCFGALGFAFGLPAKVHPSVQQVELPSEVADSISTVDIWSEDQPLIEKIDSAVRSTELPSGGYDGIRFWCPRRPDHWGEVIYSFPIKTDREIELAVLKFSEIKVFAFRDNEAQVEVWLGGIGQDNDWERIGVVDAKSDTFPQLIRVTDWVRGGKSLRVRFRFRARQLLYHPTENDPIGLAGAQALRTIRGHGNAIELHVWYKD